AEVSFILKTATAPQFAIVRVRVEPYVPEAAGTTSAATFQFVNAVPEGTLNPEFIAAARRGIEDTLQVGTLGGFPVLNVRATLLGGQQSDAESTELAFENAGRRAFEEAMRNAGP